MTKRLRTDPTVTKTYDINVTATCQTCETTWEGRGNILAVASIHARTHGHVVVADSRAHVTYDGREDS